MAARDFDDGDRVLALAGVLQAADCVRELAGSGEAPRGELATAVTSLFAFDAPDVPSVFGGAGELRRGLRLMAGLLSQDLDPETLRYGLTILQLARRLRRDPRAMSELRGSLDLVEPEDPDAMDEALFESLGGVYRSCLSPQRPQVIVNGDPAHLTRPEVAARIRTLLLAAFRAAVLWYQCGGSAWRLLLHRRRYADTAQALLRV